MSKNLYQEDDINDLIEEELEKGRGPDLKPRKQRGSLQHIADQDAADESRNAARARVNAVVAARTAKMTDSQRAKMRKSDDEMDINDLVAEDMDHEETFYKGGVGSGKKGHTTPKELASHHEREYHRLYDLADDFESSSDPEVRATGKRYREEGSKHEGLAEAHKKNMKTMTPAQKDAKIKANDKKIADHPVKTSKNSPTGG